jgi:hypothetical protein
MRLIDRLGFAQRIVVVVALGLALGVLGNFLVNLGSPGADSGWFGYAPLTRSVLEVGGGLSGWQRLLVWLAVIAIWAAASLRLLTPDRRPHRDVSS